MNTKFTLKKYENENKSLNSEKNNLVNELEMLQGNFSEYQKKYLDGNRRMQKFEAAAKGLLVENERLGKERDLYRSAGCSGVGS
jgi:peptidoglycan hydrolase CwlO-like protein